MATLDGGHRQRDVLPPLNRVGIDLEKFKVQLNETNRYHHSYSTAPLGSPTTMYSGPPPPYSSASSVSGYVSPAEATTRRQTREDQLASPNFRKSLPSIHEALSDKGVSIAGPPLITTNAFGSAPASSVGQTFPDGPRGPPNPFSVPAPAITEPNTQSTSYAPLPPPPLPTTQSLPPAMSPRTPAPSSSLRHHSLMNSGPTHHDQSPRNFESAHPTIPYSQYNSQPPPVSRPPEMFQFTAGHKEESYSTFPPAAPSESNYGETVKRHLEIWDADVLLHEINDASLQTSEFSRVWSQRYQQSSRSSYLGDALPAVTEIDDMIRQAHRIMENLTHVKELAVAQQAALSEQRARLERGVHLEEEVHHGMSEDFRNGSFGGCSDAKKRRGKAAPPGRCHSCNRAETPEWRRGPDGARTLCNACGLHYAKLTRKMGVNKAAALTGSTLRPKPHDQRP